MGGTKGRMVSIEYNVEVSDLLSLEQVHSLKLKISTTCGDSFVFLLLQIVSIKESCCWKI